MAPSNTAKLLDEVDIFVGQLAYRRNGDQLLESELYRAWVDALVGAAVQVGYQVNKSERGGISSTHVVEQLLKNGVTEEEIRAIMALIGPNPER